MMKKMLSLLLVVVLTLSCFLTGAYAEDMTDTADTATDEIVLSERSQQADYSDIAGHWAESEIAYVTAKGYIDGFDIEFRPDQGMTRAAMVTALASIARDMEKVASDDSSPDTVHEEQTGTDNTENQPEVEDKTSNIIYGAEGILFSDITGKEPYATDLAWAVEKGIINGIDGAFCPEVTVDRQTVAVMLFRFSEATGIGLDSEWEIMLEYNDLEEASYWAIDSISYCTITGLMSGDPDGNFAPQRIMTKAESAVVLHRLCNIIDNNHIEDVVDI